MLKVESAKRRADSLPAQQPIWQTGLGEWFCGSPDVTKQGRECIISNTKTSVIRFCANTEALEVLQMNG